MIEALEAAVRASAAALGVVAFRGADDDTAASRVAAVVVELCAGRRDGFQAVRGAAAACFSAASVDTDAHARETAADAVAAVLRRLSDSRHCRPASCALLAALSDVRVAGPSWPAPIVALLLDAMASPPAIALDERVLLKVVQCYAPPPPATFAAPPSGDDAAVRAAAAAYVQTVTVAAAATGIACTLALWEPACAAHALLDAALGERHAKAVAEAFVDAAYAHAETLEQAGDDGAAERQRALARELARRVIRAVAPSRHAVLCARKWRLTAEFAAEVTEHRETTVRKLLAQGKYRIAAEMVGADARARELLVSALEARGDLGAAMELRTRWALVGVSLGDDGAPPPSAEAVSYAESCRRARYLRLPDDCELVVIDDADSLARDGERFAAAVRRATTSSPRAFGLDVEWPADFLHRHASESSGARGARKQPRASLLQLGTRGMVALFDLPALLLGDEVTSTCAGAFDDLLAPLFASPEIVKLGFGGKEDLKVLRASWPLSRAFECVDSYVELSELSAVATRDGARRLPASAGAGLSATCERWLGRPLDKREQLSDWAARPLSASQTEYAALDAWCLVAAFDAILAERRERRAHEDNDDAWWRASLVESRSRASPSAKLADETPPADGAVAVPLGVADVERQCEYALGARSSERWTIARDSGGLPSLPGGDGDEREAVDAKSIALLVSDAPVVVVLRACDRVDLQAVARERGCARRQVRFATHPECVAIFGYAPGSVPPVGHRAAAAAVMVDSALVAQGAALIRVGGGAIDAHLFVRARDLLALTRSAAPIALAIPPAPPAKRTKEAAFSPPAIHASARNADRAAPRAAAPAEAQREAGARAGVDYARGDAGDAHELRFLADSMLGRLSRWLRVMGVDVEPIDEPEHKKVQHAAIIDAADALGRVVLTRDRKLAARFTADARGLSCFLVEANDTQSQFEDVCARFDVRFRPQRFMSRCAVCNGLGFDVVAKSDVRRRGGVKEKVLARVAEFWECRRCKKVYWEGPKYETACDKFATLFDASGQVQSAATVVHTPPAFFPTAERELAARMRTDMQILAGTHHLPPGHATTNALDISVPGAAAATHDAGALADAEMALAPVPFGSDARALVRAFRDLKPAGSCEKHAGPWPCSGRRISLQRIAIARVRRLSTFLVFAVVAVPSLAAADDGDCERGEDDDEFVVQLVMGKELVERLGPEAFGALVSEVRVGCEVSAVGFPQRNRGHVDDWRTLDVMCSELTLARSWEPEMAEAAFVRGLRGAAPQTLAADSLGTLVPGFSRRAAPTAVPTDFARSVLGLAAQTLRRDERLSRADRASSPPEQTRAVEAIVSSAREIADRGSWSCEIDATQLLLCVALDEQAAGGADDAACRAVALRAAMVTAGPAPGLSDAIARRPDWQSRLASGELAQALELARVSAAALSDGGAARINC